MNVCIGVFPIAPSPLMRSLLIVELEPRIEIGLKLIEYLVNLLAKRYPVKLIDTVL